MGLGNWLIEKLSTYLTKEEPAKRSYLSDFDRVCYEVRPADVILVEGHNRISRIIQRITQSPWSHAALYIGRLHDVADPVIREKIHQYYAGPTSDQLIIEAMVGEGVIISPISKYKNDHVRICRPTGISYKDTQKVISHAIDALGKQYNIRHFLDLGRFLLASRFIPRRWYSSLFTLDVEQATQDICSTMIATAFGSIKFPILPYVQEDKKHQLEIIQRNPKLFTPSDFDYSPYFSIIKYPIFSIADQMPYQNLPWKEGYIHSDEVGISEKAVTKKIEKAINKNKKKKKNTEE